MPDLVELFFKFLKAIWRAVNVKRKAPGEKHAAVEYIDSFLFGEEKNDRYL